MHMHMMNTKTNRSVVNMQLTRKMYTVSALNLTLAFLLSLSLRTISSVDAAFISSSTTSTTNKGLSSRTNNKIYTNREYGGANRGFFRAGGGFHIMMLSDDGQLELDSGGDTPDAKPPVQQVGHDYLPPADAGPISPLCKLTEGQIHYLITKRGQCKKARNFQEADKILDGLTRSGVYLHDKRKEWRADGINSFGRVRYVRRGHTTLSEEALAIVASMVEQRSDAKRNGEFHRSDELTEALKNTYGVKVNDKEREWSILSSINVNPDDDVIIDLYAPSPLAPQDSPTHTMDDEAKEFIQKRVTDRVMARKRKEYDMADLIRDELKNDYSVVIDDRTKEWKVVTSDEEAFVREAKASQRSASVREKVEATRDVVEDREDVVQVQKTSGDKVEEVFEAAFPVEEGEAASVSVDEAEAVPAVAEENDDDVLNESHLATLTIVALKEKLRAAGLPVSGKKAELIERLVNSSIS